MRVVSVRTLSSGRGRNRKVEFVRGKCATKTPSAEPAIRVSEAALAHIKKLREEAGGDELLLRVGVKEGGCSGMSYTMDFEKEESVLEEDSTLEYGDMKIVCDPKSLLYLYGMELDYKSALIGGGFSFRNPNAEKTCGCGKSFST